MNVDLQTWLAFVAASTLLLIIPGPTVMTIIAYSASHGRAARLPLVAAVALGDCTALAASLLGLGLLMETSAIAFTAFKAAGGLYLLFLGFRLWINGKADAPPAHADVAAQPRAPLAPAQGAVHGSDDHAPRAAPFTPWKLFASTYAVTALNPKGILFFLVFLPQFVAPEGNAATQLWLLACTFVALATLNSALYSLFACAASRHLTTRRGRRGLNVAGGAILCGAGIWALLARHPA
jgi:threonine/homoserine/homoserine lactone efflux protein